MKTAIWVCDLCTETLDGQPIAFMRIIGPDSLEVGYDLCPSCYQEILSMKSSISAAAAVNRADKLSKKGQPIEEAPIKE